MNEPNQQFSWMDRVKLYTSEGHQVAEVLMLPFRFRMPVVFWGERLFVYNELHAQYREEMYTVVWQEHEGPYRIPDET